MEISGRRKFFMYVIPSVLAFALSGVYTIVDGFFIGNQMGDDGIAAISIGYPVAAFIMAVGTGLGLAGGIRYTILSAQGEARKTEECFTASILLMAVVSLILTVLIYFTTELILELMGASGVLLEMGAEYVRVIALGTLFQLLATGFVPFIRNMNGARFAMIAMIMGFLTNIVLDFLFVWELHYGMAGAAWATVIGQAVTMVMSVIFFKTKKVALHMPPVSELGGMWGGFFKVALSPFGLAFSPTLTLLFMNRFLFLYGDDQAVAVFGCIDYVLCISYMLFQGVGDGSQPLISWNFGEGNIRGIKLNRRLAYETAAAIGAIFVVVVFLYREKIGLLFGASPEANLDVIKYIPWFLATLILLSIIRVTTTYLYATEKTTYSYILVYGEPLGTLAILCILPLLMPSAMKITAVWLSIPLGQVVTFITALILKQHTDKKLLCEDGDAGIGGNASDESNASEEGICGEYREA
ncbi:MAG: MATE family efflux transporter [Clostridia bacterium]|nr:MATE family efflux transporter [Clostridia bacterium]